MTLSVQLVSGVATDTGADALIIGVFAGTVGDSDALLALEDALGGGLLSHLKASEFDYIIFDMPPTQRSYTSGILAKIGTNPPNTLAGLGQQQFLLGSNTHSRP